MESCGYAKSCPQKEVQKLQLLLFKFHVFFSLWKKIMCYPFLLIKWQKVITENITIVREFLQSNIFTIVDFN